MLAQTMARHEKNRHVQMEQFPNLRTVNDMLYWGVFSWQLPKLKERWVKSNSALLLGNLALTPGDAVRDYLDFYHPKTLRAIGTEARLYGETRTAPLFVKRSLLLEGTYIDIRSAFFSIVKMVGWNINYMPGQWINPGRAPIDFPYPEIKGARNYLVSIALPAVVSIWNGYSMVYKNGHNAHINRGLWRCVMDILHSIASYAVYLGAVYVHTDGYILPSEMAPLLSKKIEEFGLESRVLAQGETLVIGFGNYMVGDKKTKSFDPSTVQEDFKYIEPTPADWLQRNLSVIREHDYPRRLYERSVKG